MKQLLTLLTAVLLLSGCADESKRRQTLIEEFKTTEVYKDPEAEFLLRKADGSVWLVHYQGLVNTIHTQTLVFPPTVPAELPEEVLAPPEASK